MRWRGLYSFFLLFLAAACAKDSEPPQSLARAGNPGRGRAIYLANCVACHNTDPSKEGSIGPAIKGSSRDLLEARLLRASYPPGHNPKRKTSMMPAQPYLKSAIPDLAAYLG